MDTRSPRIARRRVRTSIAVVDAAEALLVEGGLSAITMEAVAERADVAIATLYSHFDGKDEVLAALGARAIARNSESLDAALATTGTAAERLEAIAKAYLAFHLANPSALRVLSMGGAARREQTDEALDRLVRRVAGVIEDGVRDGELRSDIDAMRIARFVWGAWNSTIALHARGTLSRAELKRTLDDALRVTVDGLRTPGRT